MTWAAWPRSVKCSSRPARPTRSASTCLKPGTRWTSTVSVGSTERYEIVATGETVATPAGSFDRCVRVRATNRASGGVENVLETTYAPGVGQIRIETWALVGGKVSPQFRAVLASYRVSAAQGAR